MQPTSAPPRNYLEAALRHFLGLILLVAVAVMLIGVSLRFAAPIAEQLDLPRINVFWVEETGELLLGWLTFVGAGFGVLKGAHFSITLLVEKFPPATQRRIFRFNMAITAGFGLLLAWHGWQFALLNLTLTTPALGISMGWIYAALVMGGLLVTVCAIIAALRPPVALERSSS